MGEGMPKPKSTIDTIKSRRKTIDDAEREATGAEEPPDDTPYDKPKVEPKKGLPKPGGLLERVKKFVTGEK